MSQNSVQVFDINNYLQEHSVVNNIVDDNFDNTLMTFDALVDKINEQLNNIYDDSKLTDEDLAERQELEHEGAIGNKNAEKLLISEIETLLRKQNLLGIPYPDFYDSLAHGIFHEIYRFGVFHKWERYPNSPSAIIKGKEIWFKIDGTFVKQDEELRSEEHIYEIIRLLQIGNSSFKVNEANPEDEIILSTGVRIKVMIPPLSNEPTIVFRRFVVDNFSFLKQADYGTIPYEDIAFYDVLSNLYLNTIIAGHVESGKSTFLKTIYGARDPHKVAVLVETSPETYLKRDFPDRLVHELYTDTGDIHDIMRSVLRIDHDYVIVQEVRGIEAEGAISATERGTTGTLMTYHITDPANTPIQLAQHITDEFPNRNITNEIRRIAKQLDVGITMENFENNQKKVTSVYEICYDINNDEAWINYLIKYDPYSDKWQYNSNISHLLKDKIYNNDRKLANVFIKHLEKRAKESPIETDTKIPINYKG